ncbi:MAG: fasciclin domain-containing protein [Armatimonadetes bacterium]|nr:fasciclin domain-containing protein [Armatimonadota bacterium]
MKTPTKKFAPLLTAALALSATGAHADTVVEKAAMSPQFETLTRAIRAAGLEGALEARGSFTLFAPTDAAFAKLPPGTLEELLKPSRKATLASILRYHILPRRYSSRTLMRWPSGTNVSTLNGENFAIRKGGGVALDPFVSERANIVQTDVRAENGVIHAIDQVLVPPSLAYALARNPAFKNENRSP